MFKYVMNVDEKGLCTGIGEGSNTEKYKAMGMTLKDIEQSEVDGQWYLTEKCPHYTEEEKEQQRQHEEDEAKQHALELAIDELIKEMAKADLMGDEDWKNELRAEYEALISENEE